MIKFEATEKWYRDAAESEERHSLTIEDMQKAIDLAHRELTTPEVAWISPVQYERLEACIIIESIQEMYRECYLLAPFNLSVLWNEIWSKK